MARPISIEARWTYRNVAAILLAVGALGAYLYPRVEARIERDAMLLLELQASEIRHAAILHRDSPEAMADYVEMHVATADPSVDLGIRIFDREGNQKLARGVFAEHSVPPHPAITSGERREHHYEIDLGREHPYLVMVVPTPQGFAEVAIHSGRFRSAVEDIRDTFFLAIPLVLVLTGGLGWGLARRSLQPIARITRAARRISARRLDERIPISGSGDELDRLAETLNDMISRIEDGMGRMHRFSLNAAHQLRTPLNAVRNQIDVTLQHRRDAESYERVLRGTLDQVLRLEDAVDGMLRLGASQVGIDPRRRSPVALADLVESTVSFFAPVARERGVDLHFARRAEATVLGDSTSLRELLANLIDNAIKYTSEGGKVWVEVVRDAKLALVRVRDTGGGVCAEDATGIFEPFTRATSEDEAPGAGLGLTIAQEIARVHGGRIDLESELGGGSVFTVRLPDSSLGEIPSEGRE